MGTYGGSSFPGLITLFLQGHRVSRTPSQILVPRSGSSFLVPDLHSSFPFLIPDVTYRFITIQIIGAPQNVVCSHPAPATGNLCDVPHVRLINTPRHKHVRDGGRTGIKAWHYNFAANSEHHITNKPGA